MRSAVTFALAWVTLSVGRDACLAQAVSEPVLTLDHATELALGRTNRARIIRGDEDIARQSYHAKRLNFYLPTISINGATPSYETDQSYRFFGGSSRKQLYKTTDFGVTSFIKLEQFLVSGGSFVATANLASTKNEYPDTDPLAEPGSFLDERSRRGYFDFVFEQPILKPSTARHELHTADDERKLARLTRLEEESALRKQVGDAYLDVLQGEVTESLRDAQLERARLTAEVDSTKWQDAVVTQEAYLGSALARLDAELARRSAGAELSERRRELALLMDADPGQALHVAEPPIAALPTDVEQQRWLDGWEGARPIQKAELEASKARRSARFTAGGRGLTGNFRASYSSGHGEVRLEDQPDEPIDTEGWGVSLNLSYPLWDGGASDAAARTAEFAEARANLELARAKQDAHSAVLRLVNEIAVGYRRLEIQRSQIELAHERVAIAEERMADGRVSRIGFLETQIKLLESRGDYLTELKAYLANRTALHDLFDEES